MAFFPLFFNISGKKCIVVGGGKVAERKIHVLREFEAEVTVISPEVTKSLEELEQDGKITVLKKSYEVGDLGDAFLVVCATSDLRVNALVYEESIRRGILVNMTDGMREKSFSFSSIVKRGDIVAGISTSGDFPLLAAYLKDRVDEALNRDIDMVAEVLKELRIKVQEEDCSEKRKRIFLKMAFNEVTGSALENNPLLHSKKILQNKMDRLYREFFGKPSSGKGSD